MKHYSLDNRKVSIVAVCQHPDKVDHFILAQPYELFATFQYENKKVRARLTQEGSQFIMSIKVNKSKQKPIVVSSSRILFCLKESYVEYDDEYYVDLKMLQIFTHEFARIYVSRKYNLPYQLTLPIYGQNDVNILGGLIDEE